MNTIRRLAPALAGRFEVEREIGAGGMAVVYLARDLKHDRKVAIKVLRPELAEAVGSERFEREIQVVAKLRHPHILPLHDSGTADGLPYFVMPFVDGESLRDLLNRERQLTLQKAVRIAREVAEGLAYAHGQGVVHRDIKPANIMLDSGHAVITDFGVAFIIETLAGERLTESGFSPGTPHYMSPEQASGDHQIDSRSDIYSLGCLLYEMLVGDAPFTGSSHRAIVARKLVDPVPGIRVVREAVPEVLEQVTFKALARTPADRFQTASEFAAALAAVGERLGETGEGVGVFGVAAPLGRRPSTAKALAITVGYLALGGALLLGLGLLTTTAFDIKLEIPTQYTPSRSDFLLVGGRVLVPLLVFGFALWVAFVAVRYALRLGGWTLERTAPALQSSATKLWTRYASGWGRFWQTAAPSAVAEAFFLSAVVVSVLVLWQFRQLLGALWTTETDVLACGFRPLHRSYWLTMAALITVLGFARYRVFHWLKARPGGSRGSGLGRWGSLTWIFLLIVLMAVPWRLLWEESYERVLIGGQRAYVLVETETDLVAYNAERRSTERYDKSQTTDFDRGYRAGYVFEEPEAFYSQQPGCALITGTSREAVTP